MKLAEFYRTASGLYRVDWKDGSSSLAAIGRDESGMPWLAPTNWLEPVMHSYFAANRRNYLQHIHSIEALTPIALNR